MPNRLANESSPYLLQHAENPVDWYAWNDEALARAKAEDKPVFLSIGYSACHWCHVMEHESFEDASIAEQLNQDFVCIKVDREERPDLDQIYMHAVHMLTGRGGWPMSVFLTPDLQPFFGGTYWPPHRRHGMPGFGDVLTAVLDAWNNRREQAISQAASLTEQIRAHTMRPSDLQLNEALLSQAATKICQQFDPVHGGFADEPKFPQSMAIQYLLRIWNRDRTAHKELLPVVTKTLDAMAQGGIYDHLAGGFARYSVDAKWLVPHFEKMLYDNALLIDAYIDAWQATGEMRFGRIADETCDYVLNYMTDPLGGFHSTEDADSEGVEGKFYVWSTAEVIDVLGESLGERFCKVFDVTEHGNFEGHNILNLRRSLEEIAEAEAWDLDELQSEMAAAKEKLLQVRDQRVRPAKDDKILVSWNGLMIHSMARAGAALGDPTFIEAAKRAAHFVLSNMRRPDGRLYHTWRNGKPKLDAYLDDYTHFANALVTLYESTFESEWIDVAVEFAEVIIERFADTDGGGLFYTADDHESLIARTKDLQDNSIPSGNAMAATLLLRLGQLCHRDDFISAAEQTLSLVTSLMGDYPLAVGQMLNAADLAVGPVQQCVLSEPSGSQLANRLRQAYLPRAVLAAPGDSPHLQDLIAGKSMLHDQPTLYVCEAFTCQQPAEGEAEIDSAIRSLVAGT